MIGTGLVFLMLTVLVSPAQSQEISLASDGAILTCTGAEDGGVTWKKDSDVQSGEKNQTFPVRAANGAVKGEFSCQYTDHTAQTVTHMFYLNAKVCENCYELSSFMVIAIVFGDLVITGAVILGVYVCVPKNTGSTQKKASKPRTQSAPPVPNPDYQELNQRSRTTDVYSALK
ncbi:T-cell surface glycoprotein CD3 epsilon chain-like [Pseudorasbora parva]|uniref:T-cell surface glycoprotein CD3 epsilon chain-like n=1 Tax=Pseudorasbora parva TaxID=51549 RepID=UPI00351F2184